MDIIKKVASLAAGLLILSLTCFSQRSDSIHRSAKDSINIPKRVVVYAADKFAIARPFNIEFTHVAPYNFSSEKGGKLLPESKVNSFSQVKVSANINFIKKKNWLLGATAGYRYTNTEADITIPVSGGVKVLDGDFHYFFSSVNFSYFSTLFNKRVIYSSSILLDGSDKHVERVKGMVTGTLILKANQRTKMTAGLLFNIDPSVQSPFMPTFSYEHKFSNGWMADINLPKSIYLRKNVLTNGRVSLGAELDRTSFYLYDIDGTPQRYEYRQVDISSGLTYEHLIAKYFVLTAKTGMRITPSGRVFRKEDSFGSPVFQTTPDPAFYVNAGISFNPFSLIGKKK
ncbi:DUF6268 family outer membrane beta-barrel protein [Chitinophaga sp. 22321]|uniref:DUF6268 domain-containing protein n=1 Tax=Chitinophaga hostae TaxID=2831022 RepID=A0ABS5IXF5_9BACT|nr:DUF6268 family outer membrane beta-barrel protein [Chitinophaga hostae]MBS0027644.1 hypothetical protein [Chitinophaga hostae]